MYTECSLRPAQGRLCRTLSHNERLQGVVHKHHSTAQALLTTLGSTGKCQTPPDWVSCLTKGCIAPIAQYVTMQVICRIPCASSSVAAALQAVALPPPLPLPPPRPLPELWPLVLAAVAGG